MSTEDVLREEDERHGKPLFPRRDRHAIVPTPEQPFPVEITGHGHPHRGARGMAEPEKRAQAGGNLIRVSLDSSSEAGVGACYADRSELKRLEATK